MPGRATDDGRRDLTLHQMRCFTSIVDAGSVSRAAARLGITQSAASRLLAQIETTLGTRLFERTHSGLQLTEAGAVLRDASREIIHSHDAMRDEISALSGELRGHCRVAMPESVGRALFLPLVQNMGQRHPTCSLRVMAAFSARIPELLLSGQLDVAIVTDTHPHAGLDTEALATEPFVLIGRRDDPDLMSGVVDAARLDAFPLILTAWTGGIRTPIDNAAAALGSTLDVRLEIDSNQAILDLIQAGEGYSILPFSAVHREVEDGALAAAKISRPEITRRLYLATPANRPVSPVSREVARVMKHLLQIKSASFGWAFNSENRLNSASVGVS